MFRIISFIYILTDTHKYMYINIPNTWLDGYTSIHNYSCLWEGEEGNETEEENVGLLFYSKSYFLHKNKKKIINVIHF